MPGHVDVDRAMRFAAEMRTPPVVLRDRAPLAPQSGAFLQVLEGADIVAGSKVSEDGTGIVVRLLNFKRHDQRVTIDLGSPLSGAVGGPARRARTDGSGNRRAEADNSRGTRCGESILLKWGA